VDQLVPQDQVEQQGHLDLQALQARAVVQEQVEPLEQVALLVLAVQRVLMEHLAQAVQAVQQVLVALVVQVVRQVLADLQALVAPLVLQVLLVYLEIDMPLHQPQHTHYKHQETQEPLQWVLD
jgi:hypothetical protein